MWEYLVWRAALIKQQMLILYYQRLFLFLVFLVANESTTRYLYFWYNVETITPPNTILLYYNLGYLSINCL